MHDRPHWSYSSISQYTACPLRFYFQRVLGLPQTTVSSGLVLGSAVHKALAYYHQTLQDNVPVTPDELQRSLIGAIEQREQNVPITFRSGEGRDELIAQGIGLIEAYLKEPPPRQILAIEEEMVVPIHNSRGEYLETPLVAVADLITDDGELTVHEYKTSARAYSEVEAETSLQPSCYAHAVRESTGQTPKVEYTVLIKTKTPRVQRLTTIRTDDDFGRLGDIIERVEQAVQAGIFYPIESPLNCSGCPYREPCRGWGRPRTSEELVTLGLPNTQTT